LVSTNLYGTHLGSGSVTINNAGSVTGNIYGNYQDPGTTNASVGNVVSITNSGTVADITGSWRGTGNVYINNTGTVGYISGSEQGTGNVVITNSGTVTNDVCGGCNSTGNITITNTATGVITNDVSGVTDGSGSTSITNQGAINGNVYGNRDGAGSVSIVNSGTIAIDVFGNTQAGGTPNASVNNPVSILNSGTINGKVIGNDLGTGDAYINNTGTVNGMIVGNNGGTGNAYITNSGTVGGSILAGPGNDTVTILPGSNVTGLVDGQAGTNTLSYRLPGSIDQATLNAKYINFQYYSFGATGGGATALSGTWNLPNGFTVVPGGNIDITGTVNTSATSVLGTLNIYGHTLNTGSLFVGYGGTANVYGSTNVSGDTSVDGALNVHPWGVLNTGNLWINPGGQATVYGGYLNVSSATTVGGTLTVDSGGTLNTGALTITPEGAVYVYGLAAVSGATSVAGYLSVPSGGWLSMDSLEISRGGLVSIDGTVSAGFTVCNGGLSVNGTLASPTVLIGSAGVLWGSGRINGQVTNYGAISPGNSIGTLAIRGGLSFEQGSLYLAELNSNGRSDLIAVEGPAGVSGGRVLTSLPQALYVDRFAWNILGATGGVTGGFAGVDGQPASQTLSLHAVTYGDHVSLEVWRRPFASFGTGGGARELGAGLDRIVPLAVSRQGDLANLIYSMDWSYGRGQIQNALNRLSPEMYASYASAGLEGTGIFDRALERRVDEVRLGRRLGLAEAPAGEGLLMAAAEDAAPLADVQPGGTAGPEAQGWSFWGGGLGSWSSRSGAEGRLGLRQSLGGVAAGLDGRLNDWLLVGLGVGASKSSLDWGQSFLRGGLKGLHTGVYAGAEAGPLHGQASLAYSQYEADGRRDIDLAGVDPLQAGVSFRAKAGLARLSGGYDFRLGSWLLGPAAGVRYAQIRQESFRESGAGFLSLNVGDQDCQSLTTTLGLQAASLFPLGAMQVMPKVSLEWRHEHKRSESELAASFPGYTDEPFRTTGPAPVADVAVMQAGLTTRVQGRLSAFADYSLTLGQGYAANAVSLGLQYQF
jgi:uncharacterized protein with beta-barrel porin domain